MKIVFMFSGQGAQYAGMGRDLYENCRDAREIFDRADEALGYSIREICFNDEEKLKDTEFAQPAILTMSMAAMAAIKDQGVNADMAAGLSLGEYSALTAGGAFDFEEAVKLVQKRGKFMAEAVPAGKGAMYAIIGLDTETVEEVCREVRDAGTGYVVPANYNCPGQIAIAGETPAADAAAALAKEKGAKLAVKLKVSGPFHTKLLQPASDKLHTELEKIAVHDMKIPVYTNLTAEVISDKADIVDILTKQVISPVRWDDILRNMRAQGADAFIELGPGKALNGFAKRTLKDVLIANVENMDSLDKTMEKIQSRV
ncbi:MAG: ACP S-malonyltransferase [Lachnospiraceae bacterium]|jgi:[acyl-carrier-protein] S-malonyltransferase|nr:ACP S-malonyltransferase [Lachnospiraceae bacterium]MEE3460973.1 ACP S-malonyltransferase [Lachnospiraceae bacterium]